MQPASPSSSAFRWASVALLAAALHLPLGWVPLRAAPLMSTPDREPWTMGVSLSPDELILPENLQPLSMAAPPPAPSASRAPAPFSAPPQPLRSEHPAPLPAPEAKNQIESPPASKTPPPPPLSSGKTMAFDTAPGDARPPEKSNLIGDSATRAKDSGPAHLPLGLPYLPEGKSAEVLAIGERGEVMKPGTPSPLDGSVKKEGAPLVGCPAESSPAPPPDTIRPELKTPRPSETSRPAPARVQPVSAAPMSSSATERPAAPASAMEPKRGPAPATLPPGELLADATARPRHAVPAPVPAAGTAVAVAPSAAKPDASDPKTGAAESARVAEILTRLKTDSPASRDDGPTGLSLRPGQPGQEGNGTPRAGNPRAVTEVPTLNLSSRAGEIGEASFAKLASPVAAYLKGYLRRADTKWKAELFTDNRTRLEFGSVLLRVSLGKDGRLLETVTLAVEGEISDAAVETCKRALRLAAPHDPFTGELADQERLTFSLAFLYR